jgi:uncharacterized protein YndB with AHSA1/START domain
VTPTDSVVIAADPDTVFEILCDPDAYVTWVVGADRLRAVDDNWPQPGARFHHSVGVGPAKLHDSTVMRSHERPRLVKLRIQARPLIVADVEFRLEAVDGGTCVSMTEEATGGLLYFAGPLAKPILTVRNRLALRRLSDLVEKRNVSMS